MTRNLAKLLCLFVLMYPAFTASSEIHEAVKAALDWQLPLNKCKKPHALRDRAASRSQSGVIGHGGMSNTSIDNSGGAPTVFDTDHYQIDRYARKKKRWEKCVSNYKSGLLIHFEVLKNSAEHGLTKAQAEIIVGKLAEIQSAVISPDGIARQE